MAAWRKKYALRPKWGHKDIAARNSDAPRSIEVLRDPATGRLTSDPDEMLRILREQRLQTAQAPASGKTGTYSTAPAAPGERGYPWEAHTAVDGFRLCTRAAPDGVQFGLHTEGVRSHGQNADQDGLPNSPPRLDLLPQIKDYTLFEKMLAKAANSKAPGPDEIPNEVLKFLPTQLHRAMHSMFVAMWLTGDTPDSWKSSHTVMLYKKGDHTDAGNYRPVGLACTVYKLWTALLTAVLSDYAAQHGIINDSQQGFMHGRSTHLQLLSVLNALEDAKHFGRDIYTLYIDFSSAFDTVDHDKLLQLMWDMGFPLHAVQAVQQLYTGATTAIRTSFGTSDPIDIECGTLQGDSLSPFLFLLFIEPLLRWLHVGGRGYQHGCTQPTDAARHACSARAYADDLAVLTGHWRDMEVQAEKVTLFLQWSGMAVNHSKCGVTGMLYRSSDGAPLSASMVGMLGRRLGQVRISGRTLPFLHPHKQPYRYLGVLLTPSLNWTHQMQALAEAIIDKADGILRSMASSAQKLRMIDTLLKPYIRYSFCTGAYTAADIASIDSLVSRLAKYALHLPTSTPTAMVQEDRERGGVGVTSVQEMYVAELTAKLTLALNDEGMLGHVTSRLLQAQIQKVGAVCSAELANKLRHSRLLRTVTLLAACGGTMMRFTGGGQAQWYDLQGCGLTQLIERLRHDPMELGPGATLPVPITYFLPLLEVGITGLGQLLEPDGCHVVAASALRDHLRRQKIDVGGQQGLKEALNRLTVCLSTPPAMGPPVNVKVGAADLPRAQREVQPAYLEAVAAHAATGAGGRYPNGERTIPSYYAPRANEAATGGEQEDAVEGPGPEPPEPEAEAAPAPQPAGGGRRQQRRRPPAKRLDTMREQDNGGWRQFLTEFRRRYHSEDQEGAALQAKYAAAPPPDMPARGEIELTWRLLRWLTLYCREPEVVLPLYQDDDSVARIISENMTATFSGTGKKRHRVATQHQYVVEWAPSIIYKHHLECYTQLGYTAASVAPVQQPRWHAFDKERPPPLVRVTWKTSCEPREKFMKDIPNAEVLVAEYRARLAAARVEEAAAARRRLAEQRSIEERLQEQGIVAPARMKWEIQRPDAFSFVHLDTEPVQPELDVLPPPGNTDYTVRIAPADPGRWRQPVAHVHAPDGKWVGTLTCERLAHLRARFQQAQASRPELFAELHAGPFEEELAGLLRRWNKAANNLTEDKLQRSRGVTPGQLVEAVQAATGASTDLFASPLDVHPCMRAYMSEEARDQLFGAGLDAYSRRWVGACFAHPPEAPAELERAVRWALSCAKETDRHTHVLTVLLLPRGTGAEAYQRWLAYPEVVTLADFFVPHSLAQVAADSWQGEREFYTPPRCTGYRLVAVGNAAGRERLLRQDLDQLWAGLPQRLPGALLTGVPWPWANGCAPHSTRGLRYDLGKYNRAVGLHMARCLDTLPRLDAQYKPPAKLPAVMLDTSRLWQMPAGWVLPPDAMEGLTELYGSQQHQLCYDWQLAYFTDGSVQCNDDAHLVGAAVYKEAGGITRLIKTNGTGPNNTINRAELAAIYHVVCDELRANEPGLIFTDSKVAIHLLRRAVREPHTLGDHLHKDLLLDTARRMIARANAGVRTHIQKVKAHSGIQGNERADAAAKAAAQPDADHDYTTPEHAPFAGRWRPAFQGPDGGGEVDPEAQPPRMVSNLNASLRKALHASTKTGGSRMGVYATETARMYDGIEGDRALGKESNAMWGSSHVGAPQQRVTLLNRMGQTYTRQMAHRRRGPYPPGKPGAPPTGDERCLLCGEPDTITHRLLTCKHPQMEAMRDKRHNDAGRGTHEDVQSCSGCGNVFTILDVCKSAELRELGADSTRMLRWMVPSELAGDAELVKLRPDILRILELPSAPTEAEIEHAVNNTGQYTVQVVEIGYCVDTNWRDKVKQKLQQHKKLMELLKEAGWKVDETPHIIVLGANGTVYLSGKEALQKLGLTSTQASALLTRLHLLAVQSAYNMHLARRRLERQISRRGMG